MLARMTPAGAQAEHENGPGVLQKPVMEKMPAEWDGGLLFNVWEIIGPFGLNDSLVSVTPKAPSKRLADEDGEGRKAMRQRESADIIQVALQVAATYLQQQVADDLDRLDPPSSQ
eukprot:272214-Pleurochrysis_carterae.AAC.1